MNNLSGDLVGNNSLFELSYELAADNIPLLVVTLAAVVISLFLFWRKLINMLIAVLFVLSVVGISVDLIGHFNKNNIILEYLPKWIVFLNEKLSYSLLVGVIISIVFNYYDKGRQAKQKAIYKKRLLIAYGAFREDIMQILLSASERSDDSNLVEKLLNHNNFQDYFKEDNDRRWFLIVNQLDNRDYSYRHDLLVAFEMFQIEISNALNANILFNEKSYNYLRNLSRYIIRTKLEHDNIISQKFDFCYFDKPFMREIWSIFSLWDIINGQLEEDLIKKAIQEM